MAGRQLSEYRQKSVTLKQSDEQEAEEKLALKHGQYKLGQFTEVKYRNRSKNMQIAVDQISLTSTAAALTVNSIFGTSVGIKCGCICACKKVNKVSTHRSVPAHLYAL